MSSISQSTNSAAATPSRPAGYPLLPSEVDMSKFSYTDIRQMNNGLARTCYVNYSEGCRGKLMLELPWMMTYDGIRQPPAEFRDENAPPKYTIEFSMKGYAGENREVQELYNFLTSMQAKLAEDSCVNAMQWHKKAKMTKEVAEAILSPMVKMGAVVDQYPPKFKVKVPCWEGEWKCKVFKSGSHEPLEGDLSELVSGRMEARAIVACSALWFAGGKFGMSWRLEQMEFRTIEQASLAQYAFRDPTPLSKAPSHTVAVLTPEGEEEDTSSPATNAVAADEDEDEDEIVDSDME